jgi:dTDP-4-dehydrorhamnose reductase
MTLELAERRLDGVYHVSGGTRISRFDFATLLAKTFDLDTSLIAPSAMKDLSFPAKRPRDSSLNTAKAQRTLNNKPIPITEAFGGSKLNWQLLRRVKTAGRVYGT